MRPAGVRWAAGRPPDCGRLWRCGAAGCRPCLGGDRGAWGGPEGAGPGPRRPRSLGRAQRLPRVAAAGARGGGPCVRPGCPGRAGRPGRLPKVFVQASHGSGARKMAGLPNFGGAGEGGGVGALPAGPRLAADPGRRRRAPPPPKLSSAQTLRPRCPGRPPCGRSGGPGEPRPTAPRRREGRRRRPTPPTALRPRRRVSESRRAPTSAPCERERVPPPAKCPAPRSAEAKAPGMPALLPHPLWAVLPDSEWAQGLTRVPQQPWQRCVQGQAQAGKADSAKGSPGGLPSGAYQQDLLVWGNLYARGPNCPLSQSETCQPFAKCANSWEWESMWTWLLCVARGKRACLG